MNALQIISMFALLFVSYHQRRRVAVNSVSNDDFDELFDEEDYDANEYNEHSLPPPAFTNGIPASHKNCLNLVNIERQKEKLANLTYSSELSSLVKPHTKGMLNGTVPFGHDGFSDRFRKSGMRTAGENVAYCYSDKAANAVPKLMDMWMKSSGHKANILGKNFKLFGFALASKLVKQYNLRVYYATQFFGAK